MPLLFGLDSDMVEVGNGSRTKEEYRAYFSIWSLAKMLIMYHKIEFKLRFFIFGLFNFLFYKKVSYILIERLNKNVKL